MNVDDFSGAFNISLENINDEGKKSMSNAEEDMIRVINISALYKIIKEVEKRVRIRVDLDDLVSANELYRYDEAL